MMYVVSTMVLVKLCVNNVCSEYNCSSCRKVVKHICLSLRIYHVRYDILPYSIFEHVIARAVT